MNGYCIKCHYRQDMASPEQTYMKNGRPAIRDMRPACGTWMFKIGKMWTVQDHSPRS